MDEDNADRMFSALQIPLGNLVIETSLKTDQDLYLELDEAGRIAHAKELTEKMHQVGTNYSFGEEYHFDPSRVVGSHKPG